MRTLMIGAAGAMAAGLLMSACSSGSTTAQPSAAAPAPASSPASASATPSASPEAAEATTISLKKLDDIEDQVLVGDQGRVIYLFEADKNGKSACSGACATSWPPVAVTEEPAAGMGVSKALLSTIHRADGTTQVVYGGHPLYYFSGDSNPDAAKGQGVDAYGAEWYVVNAKGSKVESGDDDD